jgi:hypothetical protein
MKVEILMYRQRFSAVIRDDSHSALNWHSKTYGTEEGVRAAIQKLKDTDWGNVEFVMSKF